MLRGWKLSKHEKVNTIQQFTARFHVKDIYLFLHEEKNCKIVVFLH